MAFSFVLATAAGEAGTANPISLDVWTFVLQAINILVVMGGLYLLLFRPVVGIMAKREAYVESSLDSAANSRSEAEKLLAEYQELLRTAHRQAQEIIEKSTLEAQEYEQRRKSEVEAHIEQMMTKARHDIEVERQQALAALRDEMSGLAVLAAETVLRRAINEADHKELIKDFVAKVGEVQ